MADEKNINPDEEVSTEELDQLIEDMEREEQEEAVAPTPVASAPIAPVANETEKAEAKVSPISLLASKAKAKTEQSLNLELTGSIHLKLRFSSGERSIEVHCTDEALICRMADGTEFKIPTGMKKKAA